MMAKRWNWVAFWIGIIGLFVSGTLAITELLHKDVPCGGSNDCAAVAAHPSSHMFIIPNSYLGVGLYLVLTAFAFLRVIKGNPKSLAYLGLLLSFLGSAFSCYLTYIAVTEIHKTCKWCIASNIIIVLLFICHAVIAQKGSEIVEAESNLTSQKGLSSSVYGAVGVLILLVSLGAMGIAAVPHQLALEAPIPPSVFEQYPLIPARAQIYGKTDAPVTIIEFADLTCPHCQTMFPRMKNQVDTSGGKLRWVFRFFPLDGGEHQLGLPGAMLAHYAATKGKFFEFITAVYGTDAKTITTLDNLLGILQGVGLDPEDGKKQIQDENSITFQDCSADINAANVYGLRFTPTFFIVGKGFKPIACLQADLEDRLNSPEVQKAMSGG